MQSFRLVFDWLYIPNLASQISNFKEVHRHRPFHVEECENTSAVKSFAQIRVSILSSDII